MLDLHEAASQILAGTIRGRVVVNVNLKTPQLAPKAARFAADVQPKSLLGCWCCCYHIGFVGLLGVCIRCCCYCEICGPVDLVRGITGTFVRVALYIGDEM